jgi:hypothetical protein
MLVAPYEAPLAPGTPSTDATTSRGEPRVTTARSPMLTVDEAINVRHEGIAKRVDDRQVTWTDVIPRSEKEGMEPPYVCPGYSNHMYSNNMITRFHVQ